MTKEKYYTYLGENGILSTGIKIPDVPCREEYFLKADVGSHLTKDGKTFVNSVFIPIKELPLWKEVKKD